MTTPGARGGPLLVRHPRGGQEVRVGGGERAEPGPGHVRLHAADAAAAHHHEEPHRASLRPPGLAQAGHLLYRGQVHSRAVNKPSRSFTMPLPGFLERSTHDPCNFSLILQLKVRGPGPPPPRPLSRVRGGLQPPLRLPQAGLVRVLLQQSQQVTLL